MAAAVVCRVPKQTLLRINSPIISQQLELSTFKEFLTKKSTVFKAVVGSTVVGTIGVGTALFTSAYASIHGVHPPSYPWSHNPMLSSLDMAGVRRGYEVYKQVCAACHSLNQIKYRHMAGVFMSPKKAAAEAAENMVKDGPDKDGNFFERAGKLNDPLPLPYPNEEAAAAANNGAAPPDLSFIVLAREHGEDYIFSILTGYSDPPAGLNLDDGLYYNPYFAGGSISMAPPLYSEIIEYEDGTPATKSQCAKDVVTFLKWAGEPDYDERILVGMKFVPLFAIITLFAFYMKRKYFSYLKTMKVVLNKTPVKKSKLPPLK